MAMFQSTSSYLKFKRIHFSSFYQSKWYVEKAIYFGEKLRTYQGIRVLVLSLLKIEIMHAEEFALIPMRMFISKKIHPSNQ